MPLLMSKFYIYEACQQKYQFNFILGVFVSVYLGNVIIYSPRTGHIAISGGNVAACSVAPSCILDGVNQVRFISYCLLTLVTLSKVF